MQGDPQVAVLLERIEHIARGVDELKPIAALTMQLQKDQEYMADSIKQLHTTSELRGAAMHALDKRLVILERWHKFMLMIPAFAMVVLGGMFTYASGKLDSFYDFKDATNTRLSAVEFTINSPKFESILSGEKDGKDK